MGHSHIQNGSLKNTFFSEMGLCNFRASCSLEYLKSELEFNSRLPISNLYGLYCIVLYKLVCIS